MQDWIHDKQQQLQSSPNPKVARQLQAMKTRYQREFERDAVDKPQVYRSFRVKTVAESVHRKKSILSLRDYSLPGLFTCEQLDIFGGDRILLQGVNGAGKTTWLRNILGLETDQPGQGSVELGPGVKIGYF